MHMLSKTYSRGLLLDAGHALVEAITHAWSSSGCDVMVFHAVGTAEGIRLMNRERIEPMATVHVHGTVRRLDGLPAPRIFVQSREHVGDAAEVVAAQLVVTLDGYTAMGDTDEELLGATDHEATLADVEPLSDDEAVDTGTESEAPVTWADVAASTVVTEHTGSNTVQTGRPSHVAASGSTQQPPTQPRRGDWIHHPGFGLCQVERISSDGTWTLKLPDSRRKKVMGNLFTFDEPRLDKRNRWVFVASVKGKP